jgi:hypothetical protein
MIEQIWHRTVRTMGGNQVIALPSIVVWGIDEMEGESSPDGFNWLVKARGSKGV